MPEDDLSIWLGSPIDKAEEGLPDAYILTPCGFLQLDHQRAVRCSGPLKEAINPRLVKDIHPIRTDGLVGLLDKAL
jgi:hypothetical protein